MSIQEHLNKIRNAVYGHEVRESIAKGIETAYDDAATNGNANMEVAKARGTELTLSDRLVKMDVLVNQRGYSATKLKDSVVDGNWTSVFQQIINEQKYLFIPEGTYNVSNLTIPVGAIVEGIKGKSILNHIGNSPLFYSDGGYSGATLKNVMITGGAEGVWAIEWMLPHSILSGITIKDYKGNGLKLGRGISSSWCTKVDYLSFIGYFDENKKSPNIEQIGVLVDVDGGNISFDHINVQVSTIGIKVDNIQQIAFNDVNVSENNLLYFPNAELDRLIGMEINGGENIRMSSFYFEANHRCLVVKNIKGLTADDCWFNTLTRPFNMVEIISELSRNVVLSNCGFSNMNTGSYAIALFGKPVGVKIINPSMFKVAKKFINTDNAKYEWVEDNVTKGKFTSVGKLQTVVELTSYTSANAYSLPSMGVSDGVYTTGGKEDGVTLTYILPEKADVGTTLTFVKEAGQKNGVLDVRPTSKEHIKNNSLGFGYRCGPGEIGSLTVIKLSDGWYLTMRVGSWVEKTSI